MKKEPIGGIILDEDLTFVRIFNLSDEPDSAGSALEEFCFYGQVVNFISENVDIHGKANLAVTLHRGDAEDFKKAIDAIEHLEESIKVQVIDHACIVTVYGPHFKERCGLAATTFRSLGLVGINILGISTSISSISVVIEEKYMEKAKMALEDVFDVP